MLSRNGIQMVRHGLHMLNMNHVNIVDDTYTDFASFTTLPLLRTSIRIKDGSSEKTQFDKSQRTCDI